MPKDYGKLRLRIERVLSSPEKGKTLLLAVKRGRDSRNREMATLESPQHFRDEIREIKTSSISHLDDLVSQFASNCEKNGNAVFFAKTGEDVVNYVSRLIQKHGVTIVGKSKSLTTEEIELNAHLLERNKGVDIIETDLGERIIQLVKEKPYHLVFPAIHKSQQEVADIFSNATNSNVAGDLDSIMKAVRKHLKPTFLNAQMGITGANIGVAESGSFVIETNEGNARLVSSIPNVHVVVIGMEKIVGTWEEALKLVMAHPISATGTRLTNYVSILSQRLPLGRETEREMHVIILDNGRQKMREDPWFNDGLNCIRCGACMNACPTYGVLGGHVFGYIYPGPIGIPWTKEIHGLEKAAEIAPLCISCGLCKEICPAEIDIPMMIAKVKEEDVEANGQLTANKVLSRSDDFARIASATAPLSNWILQNSLVRSLMSRLLGLEKRRKLPLFERNTLEKQFPKFKRRIATPRRKAVYFPDIFANYNAPDIGKTAIQLLEQLDVEVDIPRGLKPSGMPYVSYGELRRAKKIAETNVAILSEFTRRGYDVVATEPTATYCLREVYPKLLGNSYDSLQVAKQSFEYFEYLSACRGPAGSTKKASGRIGFHIPCHQRALSGGKYTISMLKEIGYEVKVIETGTCCGMAGTFGLKTGPLGYQLSMAVGKPLFDLFREEPIEFIVTESSVCGTQLAEGTGLKLVHPLELLK